MSDVRVTIVLPTRNEEHYIAGCLDSLVATQFPADQLELLIVDGRSDDRTRDIVNDYAARYPWIRLLDNPRRIVPTALNIGIAAAKGDIIIRVDAHALYPVEYIGLLVHSLEESGADNVGGLIVTLPADATAQARAVALAQSNRFGVGNSRFRVGTTGAQWVDTVPYGCFRREIFAKLGLFDEDLTRNQDEEFNSRIIRAGGRILLDPQIVSSYYTRGRIAKMAHMLFQYGSFKPLVAQKVGRFMTARQLAPPLFVLFLVLGGLLSLFSDRMAVLYGCVLATYVFAALASSADAAKAYGMRCALLTALVFPVMHIAYGAGFIRGVAGAVVGRNVGRDAQAVPLTR